MQVRPWSFEKSTRVVVTTDLSIIWLTAVLRAGLCGGYLGHETVCARVLLILEHDVRVIVGHQLLEALRAAAYLALIAPACSEGLLGDVGHELFVHEGCEFPSEAPPGAVSTTWSASERRRPQYRGR